MSMIDIAYALTAPVEAMMFFLLFDTFFERRKAFARWQFVAGVVTLAVLIRIVNIAFMFRVGNLLGIILAAIVVSAVFYRSTWYQRLLVPILTGSIFSAIEIIVMNLILVVFDVTAVEVVSIPAYLMMGVVLSKAIGFAVCYAIRMRKSISQVALGAAYWLLFLFLFVSSVLASFLIFWMPYALNDTRYNGPALICPLVSMWARFWRSIFMRVHKSRTRSSAIRNRRSSRCARSSGIWMKSFSNRTNCGPCAMI